MAVTTSNTSGYLARPKNIVTQDTMIFGDKVHRIHKVVVHRFQVDEITDPDLYAAEPLLKWQHSEMGQWIMQRAVDVPEWHRNVDNMAYHINYVIVAKLKDIDYTFWTLKWGNDIDKRV